MALIIHVFWGRGAFESDVTGGGGAICTGGGGGAETDGVIIWIDVGGVGH